MSNIKKTYFLCPTWDYHPDGPIQLGNIIVSPKFPAEPLNRAERETPGLELFPTTTKDDVKWSKLKARSGRYGLWTQLLSSFTGLGVDTALGYDSSAEELYTFEIMSTNEFIPSKKYLSRSMASPGVATFLEKSHFRRHVYIITAVKTVHGATLTRAASLAVAPELKVGLDGVLTGIPVIFGPELRQGWKNVQENSFAGSSDFVFAFRLRKVVVHRSGDITNTEYTTAAMYGEEDVYEQRQVPFLVDGITDKDAAAEDFGYGEGTAVVGDDDDDDCVYVSVEQP